MNRYPIRAAKATTPFRLFSLPVILCLGAVSSLFLQGCPGGSAPPKITLNAIDCPKDQVKINPAVKKTQTGGAKWVLDVSVAVTCNGGPIKAEFSVQVDGWWNQKYTTNDQGKLSVKGPPQDGDPGGQSVNVNVNGSDGERQEAVTVP